MIDIHSHILPGIDDGAQTEADSIKLAQAAVKEGITTIIATPHHKNGRYENDRETILKSISILSALLEEQGIPLEVLAGQETRINGEMIEDLRNGELQPLNGTRYLFVEFPTASVPRYAKQLLFDIQVEGYIPIIVHPERNQELLEDPGKLYDFVRNGALTQVTAASVIGKFGKPIQRFTDQIIDANLTHLIASDAHNTTNRNFCLQEAYEKIKDDYGIGTQYTFMENAQLLVDGSNVNRQEPFPIRRKKFLGLF